MIIEVIIIHLVSFAENVRTVTTMSSELESNGSTTVVRDPKDRGKPDEHTTLSPNSNQTYFADERIRIPEDAEVRMFLHVLKY